MTLIHWDNSFSVNVAEIDRQHERLVAMINELNDAMLQGKAKEVLGPLINRLFHYAETHFKTEETYFQRFGYPDAESHKREHADFVAKVRDFKGQFDKNLLGLSVEMLIFLSDWWRRHIKVVDKQYGPFFNAHGLK